MKNRFLKYIFCLFCFLGVMVSASCQASRTQTHGKSKYQKVRTRHTPNWNSSTSQHTTYYIRRNFKRHSHDVKTKYTPTTKNYRNNSRPGSYGCRRTK